MNQADRTARDYLWYIYGYVDSYTAMSPNELKGLKVAIDNAITRIYELEMDEMNHASKTLSSHFEFGIRPS